jgi:uncharacterized protein (TIGR03086 family)
MTEISERYARLSQAFADKIAGVEDGAWSNRTPCDAWTAKDLVGHVIGTQGMFLGFVGEEMGELPPVDEDPGAAWDAARGRIQAGLDDPAIAGKEFEGFAGTSTFAAAVDRFLNTDLVVHGWDLARATGQDETIGADDLHRVRGVAEGFGDAMRSPQAFGEAVDAPPGADEQTKLLAFLGRHS